jgi:hypothetical protein
MRHLSSDAGRPLNKARDVYLGGQPDAWGPEELELGAAAAAELQALIRA